VIFGDNDSFLPFRLHNGTGSWFHLAGGPGKNMEKL